MQKKYFTIEDLISFCKHKKMYNFSSKESGKPLYVQAIQDFSSTDIEKQKIINYMLKCVFAIHYLIVMVVTYLKIL